jgi:hypothetical protein
MHEWRRFGNYSPSASLRFSDHDDAGKILLIDLLEIYVITLRCCEPIDA